MASPFDRIGRPRHADTLTPAEWEVLAGVRAGLSNREIAEQRGCGVETVRFHLRNLRPKIGISSRAALREFPGRPRAAIERETATKKTSRLREQIPLIATQDVVRLRRFYVDQLGFEEISRWPDDEGPPGWIALAAGAARLMIRLGHQEREVDYSRPAGTVTLCLYVDGLDALRQELVEAGVRCGKVHTLFYGAREFYVRDPDGNELSIVEFAASEPVYLKTRVDEQ